MSHKAVAILVLLGGCFSPNFANTECSDQGECPDGFVCAADNICRRVGDVDNDGGLGIDGTVAGADADTTDSGNCWTFDPIVFDPCALPEPTGGLSLPDGATQVFNGDTGVVTQGSTPVMTVPTVDFNGITVASLTDLDVPPGATLRVVGGRPVAFASETTITIAGVVDVHSLIGGPGAGANLDPCVDAGAGQPGSQGSGGGGGGGYKTPGAPGGAGASASGGSGGGSIPLPILKGGCPGGDGGAGAGTGAVAGPGGGAVALVAQNSISISGGVNAGGGGGEGNKQNESRGGAGGGSGGMIVIDAALVNLGASSILAANGGAGGEGGRAGGGVPGEDGQLGDQPARGGTGGGMVSGTGGDGGALGLPPKAGGFGNASTPGGGGGGGSVGYVVLHFNDNPTNLGIISPAPIVP